MIEKIIIFMNPFKKAKWIWAQNSLDVDDYAEFIDSFDLNNLSPTRIKVLIACDSIYAFYIDNQLVKFMTCSDFPNDKFVDEDVFSIGGGPHQIKIDVWHLGVGNSNYINDSHGLIFEIFDENDNIISFSNESILSRVMNEFRNGHPQDITTQLGISFLYDFSIEKTSFSPSLLMSKGQNFSFRNINRIVLEERIPISISNREHSILIDLKQEVAGVIDLDIYSPKKQLLTITFGEHIADGGVRRIIENRDFSFQIVLGKGHNRLLNPLRRIAGRYLEVFFEEGIKIDYLGIRPTNYSHTIIKRKFSDPLVQKIYQISIKTLELCMHEHYEDSPWREQCLYVLDSRNQMLLGSLAFEGFEYQKHNLLLIAKGYDEENGLLTLTFPCGVNNFPIPFFSLFFIKQVEEYINYSKDKQILSTVGDVIKKIMNTFLSRIDEKHLIKYFPKPFWNFYEWTELSHNVEDISLSSQTKDQYELIVNAAFVYVCESYNRLFNENIDTTKIKEAIKATFYDKDEGVFRLSTSTNKSSQLGNAFALLIGLGDERLLDKLINDKSLIEASLSVRGFIYDALLIKEEKYKDYIINDIKTRYKKMIDDGATSFYEVEEGASAFDGAGSLCHGWSAIPIYYFVKLLANKVVK